ncbi:MAG: B12-binding domain-containing radical SAM protein [Polyangiaceae bacterium]|nr:B12-binding domain-containing radical SAM protein [Polyangiaceae bacterium]
MKDVRRAVLIHPASRRYSGYLSTHRFPGLVTSHAGLGILAEVLERIGVRARVYDEKITPYDDSLVDGADLVGISVQTSWAPQAYRIASQVKKLGIPVVLGGVHATLNPTEAIQHADWVVRGEGEPTLRELVEKLRAGASLGGVAGLSHWVDGKAVHNVNRAPLGTAELDALPWPTLDRIEGITDERRYPVNRRIYFTMATRGCDQICNFCSIIKVFGGALRHRSVGSVIDELSARWDPERQFLFFMDDSLAVDTVYLKSLLQALIDHKLVPKLGWHSQMRAEVARDAELLDLMQRTNCTFVTCGFESIQPASLKALQKGQGPKDIRRAIERLRARDILVNGFFMFGTDHDDEQVFDDTVRFALESGCVIAGFMPLTPFPGTPTFESLDAEGRIFTKDWELYDVQHVVYRPRKLTPWQLYWRTMACYPRFYAGAPSARNLGVLRRRSIDPGMLVVGALWPFLKQMSWAHEVVANLDYLRELRRHSRYGTPFPDLGDRHLWAKDLISGRNTPRLRSLVP